jgi:hypothetical protein
MSRKSAGKPVRTLRGAGREREPDDPGGTASRHGEGRLLESRVRLTPHARFGGEDGETGREAPRPVLTQRRLPTASAPTSLPLSAAAERRCWADI